MVCSLEHYDYIIFTTQIVIVTKVWVNMCYLHDIKLYSSRLNITKLLELYYNFKCTLRITSSLDITYIPNN